MERPRGTNRIGLGLRFPALVLLALSVPAAYVSVIPRDDPRVPVFLLAAATLLVAGAAHVGIRITRRVRRLSGWVNAFTEERTLEPLPEGGGAELSALGHSLNLMAREIGKKMARLGESESRYRELVETMIEGLVVVDRQERITFVNRRFAEMVQMPAKELVGTDLLDLLDAGNRDVLLEQTERRRCGISCSYELTWRRSDGEAIVTQVSGAPLTDAAGRFQGSFAVITDLTARRRIEEQMSRVDKFRALGEMAGGIAHEINNRLTSILGNAQLLLLEEEDEQAIRALKIIEESAMESAETVRTVMELARAKPDSVREAVDINSLVSEVVELLRYRWKKQDEEGGVEYEVHRDLRAQRAVSCYPSELRESFVNILTNAFDGMPDGGEVRVTTFDRSDGVCVRISDTGQGMAPEVLQRAFDPFFTTRGLESSGLGLSIAFGIVRRIDGSLSLHSTEGQGTTATFFLPPARIGTPAEPESGDAVALATTQGSRLLVVDHEEGIVRLLEHALTRRGHGVETARSAAEGLALIEAGQRFDLLLTDVGTPEIRGAELAERARELDPRLRVILCASRGHVAEEEIARCGSVDLVVWKPIGPTEFVEQIEALLESAVEG
ncbi:MAG: ATP-binding protein [Planctomycetota bacterium]|jgi:PAS domain S-box-containing protein